MLPSSHSGNRFLVLSSVRCHPNDDTNIGDTNTLTHPHYLKRSVFHGYPPITAYVRRIGSFLVGVVESGTGNQARSGGIQIQRLGIWPNWYTAWRQLILALVGRADKQLGCTKRPQERLRLTTVLTHARSLSVVILALLDYISKAKHDKELPWIFFSNFHDFFHLPYYGTVWKQQFQNTTVGIV